LEASPPFFADLFANSSASLFFFFLSKGSIVKPRKCRSIHRTSARYLISSSYLASLSFSTCSLMTSASHFTRKLLTPKARTFLKPRRSASYSLVLLVHLSEGSEYSSLAAYLNLTLAGEVMIAAIPTPLSPQDPSHLIYQTGTNSSSLLILLGNVQSTTKSAKT
jgi:hypothetical protein